MSRFVPGTAIGGGPNTPPSTLLSWRPRPTYIPQPLVDQRAPGGRLVLPLGHGWQELVVIEKQDDGGVRRFD